ncbi:MAG TPA: VCBS repeat-containing protein [Fimbriiglobus sp.]|nr:VCBS repeat-containing protein [Fimbriiglobus sp.]
MSRHSYSRTRRPAFRPVVEALEARSVPAASLVSVADDGLSGANAPVTLLGTSDDGGAILVQSTATNIVPGQNDVPGTLDLFWISRTSGQRALITAQDKTLPGGAKALGAESSTPGQFLNALISGDGESVIFLSGANAQRFNASLQAATDDGGIDAYVWNADTRVIQLVSQDKAGFALGAQQYGVSNPSINTDGKTVAFISNAVMFDEYDNKYKAGEKSGAIDRGPFGPNLFSALIDRTTGTVLTPRPVTYFFTTFNTLDPPNAGTFFPPFSDISVDPLGRYMSGEGLTFIMTRDYRNTSFFPGPFPPPITATGSDVWTFSFAGAGLNPGGTLNFNAVSFVSDPIGFSSLLSDSGGTAGNAILARDRADVVVYTAKTAPGAPIVPGYINNNSGEFELYRAVLDPQNPNSYTSELITIAAGTTASGGNGTLDPAPGSYGVTGTGRQVLFTSSGSTFVSGLIDKNKALDVFQRDTDLDKTFAISVTATNPNRTGLGESRLPVQTFDGLVVAFESTAPDLSHTPDANGQSDVYVRDLVRRTTALASVVPGNFHAANDKSFGPVIGGGFRNGTLYFNSEATDLDRDFTVDEDVSQVYTTLTPLLATGAPREVAFSGGSSGFAALGSMGLDGEIITSSKFQPFPGFRGEVRVASADVTGDGVLDLIAGAGPGGGPRVLVIDGFNGRTVRDYFAFEPTFTGGVYVAGADVDGDGFAEVMIGAGEGGGPRLQIYDGAVGGIMVDDFAYESTARTGVRVASGDFNADGLPDVYAAAGVGGGPRVRVFDAKALPDKFVVLADFFAYESTQRGGAYIGGGDFDGDGIGDIITGAGPEGGPRVRVFNGANLLLRDPNQPITFLDFFAFDPNSRNGVRVALRDIDGDRTADIVVGSGGGSPRIKTYAGGLSGGPGAPLQLQEFVPFGEVFGRFGAWVG